MIMNLWHFFHLSEPNTRLSDFTRGHSLYLFTNWGKTLGGVLGPEVEDVEFSLQGSGHQLVHVDVFPVKLHTANLLMTSEKIPLFVRDIYHRLQLHGDHVQMDFMNTGSFTHTHWEMTDDCNNELNRVLCVNDMWMDCSLSSPQWF